MKTELISDSINPVRRYTAIDMFRLACAFLVVLIHMGFGNNAAIIPCLSRQAVPFFFLVSGFFYNKNYSKTSNPQNYVRSYCFMIIAVYLIWMLLWMPYTIHIAIETSIGRPWYYTVLVIMRRLLLSGMAPYWYLLVLAEGIIVLSLILKRKKYWIGWVFCVCGLILNIVYSTKIGGVAGSFVHKAFYFVFSWENNVIMSGFPMLFLGSIISIHEECLRTWKPWIIILLYSSIVVMAFVVYSYNIDLYGLPIGMAEAIVLFVFCIVLSRYTDRIPNKICYFSRNLSSVVFLTHTVFLTLLGNVFNIWDSVLRFLITVSCCIAVLLIANAINWKPLKKLLLIK